jgi:alpha-glucosidase (family GH31 glycosyl hydrolase)
MAVPTHFHLETAPTADPAAVIVAGKARFTVLTGRLIRLEYSPAGVFEDHASQAFINRLQPVPTFQLRRSEREWEIETEYLLLTYRESPMGFTSKSLSISVKSTGALWNYKDIWWSSGQLFGTARTLDGVSDNTELELGPLSRAGWGVLDDSKSVVFTGDNWVEPRLHPENKDLYFFGYGHDYTACLRDFCKVAGPQPMIPRYILGNWWSRYWAFSQNELTGLMEEFERNHVPLSVCIVDMDWHLEGWTGYTWNRNLWPEPQAFIDWLHSKGLRAALNLHPSDGVGAHEEQYAAMAKAVGQDPAGGDPVAFDIANPAFAEAYFEILHHPYEQMGVDFWWMDWQQERITAIPGLDPLWWLNHLHYHDLARDGRKRPFIFSRWGGLGNHRYPIGFSGDTEITWASLAFQPYFTATAANVGYGWWSHDIGGHMGGIEDDELYTRWVQFGAFSPILRLHSTKNPYHDRRPWGRGPAAAGASSYAMRLRHRLIPYIYTMAWNAFQNSIPLVTPMYYWNPEDDGAYDSRDQYWFGSQLVAAPFVDPADPEIGLSKKRFWLPDGDWFNFFDGTRRKGGWQVIYGGMEDIPVFAKAGAIVPLGPDLGWGGVQNPEQVEIQVFPGQDNAFELYEDDGETNDYKAGKGAFTRFSSSWTGSSLRFRIDAVQGEIGYIPKGRSYQIVFKGIRQPDSLSARRDGKPVLIHFSYDEANQSLSLNAGQLDPDETLEILLAVVADSLLIDEDRRPAVIRRLLRAMHLNSLVKERLDRELALLLSGERKPREYGGLSDAQIGALDNILQNPK